MSRKLDPDDRIPAHCPEATGWPAASMLGALAVFAAIIAITFGALVALL